MGDSAEVQGWAVEKADTKITAYIRMMRMDDNGKKNYGKTFNILWGVIIWFKNIQIEILPN